MNTPSDAGTPPPTRPAPPEAAPPTSAPVPRAVPLWLGLPLLPLGWLYGLLARLRPLAYRLGWRRSVPLGLPTLAVGNLTLGGAGKTPMAEYLARMALRAGHRPAILSRGYRRRGRSHLARACLAESPVADAQALGDEPYLLARRNPSVAVVVGADRVAAARLARIAGAPTLFILDDAYQHLRAARDCNVLLLDAARGWGNGRLPPLGILREPLGTLRRADVIVLSKANLGPAQVWRERLRDMGVAVPVFTADYVPTGVSPLEGGPARAPETLAGRQVALLCGIAQPEGFRRTVEALGAVCAAELRLGDHARYAPAELARVQRYVAAQAAAGCTVLTTEKDAVKLQGRLGAGSEPLVLEMGVRPEPAAEDFFIALMQRLG
ncbi:MAG TPA: tetraacyldisaccharide 4'-kinase [bacterium]